MRALWVCFLSLLCSCQPVKVKAVDAGAEDPSDAATADAGIEVPNHQYVLSEIVVPTNASEANAFALNVDGDADETPDNALGSLIATLTNQVGLDVQGAVTASIQTGGGINLVNLRATSLEDASGVSAWVFPGENPNPTPCTDPDDLSSCGRHLDGSGTFDPVGTPEEDTALAGAIASGDFSGGPGEATLDLALVGGAPPITLTVVGARAEWAFSDRASTLGGILGGAITEADVDDVLLPAIQDAYAAIIAVDCTGTAPDCCTPETTGESLVDAFDADQDCAVTLQELRDSSLFSSLLAPDVDLFDGAGGFNPNADGVADSVSLGLSISAAGASFDLPAGFAKTPAISREQVPGPSDQVRKVR